MTKGETIREKRRAKDFLGVLEQVAKKERTARAWRKASGF